MPAQQYLTYLNKSTYLQHGWTHLYRSLVMLAEGARELHGGIYNSWVFDLHSYLESICVRSKQVLTQLSSVPTIGLFSLWSKSNCSLFRVVIPRPQRCPLSGVWRCVLFRGVCCVFCPCASFRGLLPALWCVYEDRQRQNGQSPQQLLPPDHHLPFCGMLSWKQRVWTQTNTHSQK